MPAVLFVWTAFLLFFVFQSVRTRNWLVMVMTFWVVVGWVGTVAYYCTK